MNRLDRQSFLGPESDEILAAATIGIVGLGGGGSHLVQQLAHLGIGNFVLVDPDTIDLTNTNRLIGGTLRDVEEKTPKVDIANRLIKGLQPEANVVTLKSDWRLVLEELKDCDVLMGAVDSFRDRDQLERFARRFLIPYIDVGMDVLKLLDGQFLISGQVIRSMPGCACLRCCKFISDERLAREAERYGDAGSRPQVVWSNAVLASIAVGLTVEVLTPWHKIQDGFAYLEYDGNRNSTSVSRWVAELKLRKCEHYRDNETGDPTFDIRQLLTATVSSITLGKSSKLENPRHSWWKRLQLLLFGRPKKE